MRRGTKPRNGVGLGIGVGVGVGLGLAVGVGVGEPDCAQYLPPVFNCVGLAPPQTIISPLVHTAVWLARASGALVVLVAVQL